ncbi:CotH kinase family protein [Mycolicibacterium elephantis]|uniref:CotH kinase family protein n=1 Tax=Mycolicibacterium elephantis TaxID=81858 RepID=UPI000FE1A5DE|nr:CotH kinase family protein [Mycolicibacterium elephantis]MCV7223626.1 CotH kinase family protein [Mycolicibacterium elephantis]
MRLPRRLCQHWKWVAGFVAFVAVVALVFGEARIRPYITGDPTVITSVITENIAGTVDLFDPTVPHELTIELSEAEYDDIVAQFKADGDKKWVSADVTIDGTAIGDVAVRIKGNSTLMGLRGIYFGAKPGEGRTGSGGPGPGPGGPPGGGPPREFPGMAKVSADDPTSLPLLVSFDENAEGRGYQGRTELSVRPGAPVLNEALSLTAMTGQPTQRYSYVTYSINGNTTTRLVLEHPDEGYANGLLDSDGYLYKARVKSKLEYRGPDQSAYAEQFKQINAADTGNLQPLINFLEWLNGADDEEFARGLGEWVDLESLACYAATQNLLVNADDMAGPGQNYYLWYDLADRRFRVLSWDLNMAMMMADPGLGPHDKLELKPPPGFEPPTGMGPAGRDAARRQHPQGTVPGRAAFKEVYDTAYRELYDAIYADGQALALLDDIAETVPVTAGLSTEKIAEQRNTLHKWLSARAAALARARSTVAGGGR